MLHPQSNSDQASMTFLPGSHHRGQVVYRARNSIEFLGVRDGVCCYRSDVRGLGEN